VQSMRRFCVHLLADGEDRTISEALFRYDMKHKLVDLNIMLVRKRIRFVIAQTMSRNSRGSLLMKEQGAARDDDEAESTPCSCDSGT
jgi:hypothetical protein